MIKYLKLENVGIKEQLELNISSRLNILTGDNGLGKSFILDIIWFMLSGYFPQEMNKNIQTGYIAKPLDVKKRSFISAQGNNERTEIFSYNHTEEYWGKHIDFDNIAESVNFSDVAIYVMADGSYALWDSNLNLSNRQFRTRNSIFGFADTALSLSNKRPSFFVYTQEEIWQGVNDKENNQFFNGLLQDWQIWQIGKTKEFQQLQSLLTILSTESEKLEIGELRPFSLGDSRLYPTIKMPYGREILLPHCSSAIKRIVTLAYFLVYAWKRHTDSAELLGKTPTKSFTFLIDEVEAHLHPKWQRKIVPSLLNVMVPLSKEVDIQFLIATHSPLVMASLEPIFDKSQDLWIDFDLMNTGEIKVTEREFEKQGNVESWLQSEAFNLKSSRALEYELLMDNARKLMREKHPDVEEINQLRGKLANALDPRDEFWTVWLIFCKKNGVL